MSYKYNFIDHTADIAFEASGDTIEELFIASAYGWKESVIETAVVKSSGEKNIQLIEDSLEELLVYFLDELNFLLNTKKWILSKVNEMKIEKNKDEWKLSAVVSGEEFNPDKHEIKSEIKAVTFHQMNIKEEKGRFKTMVVFDI